MSSLRYTRFAAGIFLMATFGCSGPGGASGPYARWAKIELHFEGPRMQGRGDPNPFAVPLDVTFTSPNGDSWLVPGFYDGDGKGALDGNVWKVRFSADRNGTWRWRTQSPQGELNNLTGEFEVVDPPEDAPQLYRWGRLEYVNTRYLKFREDGYWLKAGADEPENLLGEIFGRNNWEEKKRQIDYLAAMGINSIYIMTHNLEGDQRDVWPWLGDTEEEAKRNASRFDVARLEKWRDLFEHVQARGLVIQLVLEDDSSWTGFDYARYYREIIARFGYLPALYFNFCEEHNETHTLEEALGYMELLDTIDPYHHPRAIHNVNVPKAEYIDSSAVQLASIQTGPTKPASLNQLAIDWFQAPLARRQPLLVVSFDEARPPEDRRSWWAVYMGGGIWEGILKVEHDLAEWQQQWRELGLARAFMESLPFERMYPSNHVLAKGEAFCLAAPPEIYALYLPSGGTVEIDLVKDNQYQARWYDPRGAEHPPWKQPVTLSGGHQALTAPNGQDWALLIERTGGVAPAPPLAISADILSARNEPAAVHLAIAPPPAGDLQYEIVKPPSRGSLTGTAAERTYTPQRGFTGRDRFLWRAVGSAGRSNVATVEITCNATGINTPPRAESLTVRTRPGQAVTFILRYTDPDGPGPYRVQIVRQPEHGVLTGLDNDVTYTPTPGFRGADSFQWVARDGLARSGPATVKIVVGD